jgi:hypothetical protein
MNSSEMPKTVLSCLLNVILLIIFAIEFLPFCADALRSPNSIDMVSSPNFTGFAVAIIISFVVILVMIYSQPSIKKKKIDGYGIVAGLAIMGIITYFEFSSTTYINLVNDLRSSLNLYIDHYFKMSIVLIVILLMILIISATSLSSFNKTKNYDAKVKEKRSLNNTSNDEHSNREYKDCRFCGSHRHSSLEHEDCRFCGSHEHSSLEHEDCRFCGSHEHSSLEHK